MKRILLTSGFALLLLASCKDNNDPLAEGRLGVDTMQVDAPPPPPEPLAPGETVEVRSPDGKAEIVVPAPPPPPKHPRKPRRLPPPPHPPKLKLPPPPPPPPPLR